MYFKKTGFPAVNDVILCTVKKILYHSVFVRLDEYDNKEGMVHISEVSPGRIRNLRDFVREDKIIVCKVLRVNAQKGHIDLSLRRVNLSQRKKKVQERAQEGRAEKLLEVFAKQHDIPIKSVFEKLGRKIIDEYETLFDCFTTVVESGSSILEELGIDKKMSTDFTTFIQDKIKKSSVSINGVVEVQYQTPDGMATIKKLLASITQKYPTAEITYISAPRYRVSITESGYKEAEAVFKDLVATLQTSVEKQHGIFSVKKDG